MVRLVKNLFLSRSSQSVVKHDKPIWGQEIICLCVMTIVLLFSKNSPIRYGRKQNKKKYTE